MGTTVAVPSGAKEIFKQKTVFDLDSKGDVTVKKVGQFTPVANMQDFVARLGNDAEAILRIVNAGLEDYERERLASDESIPWQVLDDEGKPAGEFKGFLLSEEKSKQLNASVLNFAKLSFGYNEASEIKDAKERSKARQTAKDEALAALLTPAAIEGLKKS